MMKLVLSIFVFLTVGRVVSAGEVAHGNIQPESQKTKAVELPLCVDTSQAEQVRSSIKANKNSNNKYLKVKEVLASDSEEETMARLVYAETLAANCPEEKENVAQAISMVVLNRINVRRDVKSVIFQKDQFASSLNVYQESRLDDFLCPKDLALWQRCLNNVKAQNEQKNKSNDPEQKQVMHYFLYNHSPRFKKEPWSFKEFDGLKEPPSKSCIRLFYNKQWR